MVTQIFVNLPVNDLDGHVWDFFWMNPNHVQ